MLLVLFCWLDPRREIALDEVRRGGRRVLLLLALAELSVLLITAFIIAYEVSKEGEKS